MKPQELASMSVTELLTESAAFSPEDRVSEVMGHLKESNSYEVFVEDGPRTSTVMVRDLLGITSLDTRVSTIMHQVPRLNLNNAVGDAATLMFEHRARSMPVYSGDSLKGVVTSPSIVAELMDSPQTVRTSSLMTAAPVTVPSSAHVSAARDLMVRKRIDQVPLLDGGRVRGVVTSSDIVFNLMPGSDKGGLVGNAPRRMAEPIGQLFGGSPPLSEITETLDAVYDNLVRGGTNYCLIMNTGELQGILTYRDFMRLLLKPRTGPSLPMYVVGLPEDPLEASAIRTKFQESVGLLKKAFPDISEARVVIKTRETKAPKKRREVKVLVLSPTRRYSYSVASFYLTDAFEKVHEWAKKTVGEDKPDRRRKTEGRQFPQ